MGGGIEWVSAYGAIFSDVLWLDGVRKSEIHQQKDETFMKKVSFCRMSYINTRSLVYESPNWIIFDVLLSNRIAQFGEILISLPQMRAFGVALFLSE